MDGGGVVHETTAYRRPNARPAEDTTENATNSNESVQPTNQPTENSQSTSAGNSAGDTNTNTATPEPPKVEEGNDFECNICLDVPRDTVVSLCGHLYCWPCLYQWLELHAENPVCPVCKAAIDRDKVVPIYGRGKSSRDDPRNKAPPRPQGQRTEPQPQRQNGWAGAAGGGGPQFTFSAGFGFFPSLFGLQFTYPMMQQPFGQPQGANGQPATAQEMQQQFLSTVLCALGFFVLFSLLFY
eukprot:Colp12_sorted_trinity150504_noHs@14468